MSFTGLNDDVKLLGPDVLIVDSNAKIFKEKYVLAKPEFPEERVGGQTKTPSVWNGVEDFWRTYGQIYFFEINTSLIWTLTDPFTVLPITAA